MMRDKVSNPQLIGSFSSSGSGESSKGRWGWGVLRVGMRVVLLQTLLVSLDPSHETITGRYLNGLSAGPVPGPPVAPSACSFLFIDPAFDFILTSLAVCVPVTGSAPPGSLKSFKLDPDPLLCLLILSAALLPHQHPRH